MKKIILGKELEERLEEIIADCNFCGEKNKDCVKASTRDTINTIAYDTKIMFIPKGKLDIERVMTDCKPLFLKGYKTNDYNYKYTCENGSFEEVIVNTKNKEIAFNHAYICKDCIKQLAKLI